MARVTNPQSYAVEPLSRTSSSSSRESTSYSAPPEGSRLPVAVRLQPQSCDSFVACGRLECFGTHCARTAARPSRRLFSKNPRRFRCAPPASTSRLRRCCSRLSLPPLALQGVAPEDSTGTLGASDSAVDHLLDAGQSPRDSPHAGDLLRAISAASQRGRLDHVGGIKVSATAASTPTCRGVAVSRLRSVHGIVVGVVASQSAPDRTGMALQSPDDLRVGGSGHSQGRNRVSLFLGELVLCRQGCNPVPRRMRMRSISPLPAPLGEVWRLA